MATVGLIETLLGGVQSGAGARALHGVTNQTSEFENILSPRVPVGRVKVDGIYRKHFGNAAAPRVHVTAFDYPRGEPGVYALSKTGPSGLGNLADGAPIEFDQRFAKFNPAVDLTEAQAIAMGEDSYTDHTFFSNPSHRNLIDKSKLDIADRLREQAEEYQDMKIRNLTDKGFSPEEIERKLVKERDRAIEQAERQPFNPTALLEATLAREVPVRPHENYPGLTAAPGAKPAAQNSSSFDRAIGLNPNKAYARKAAQQINVERRLRGIVDREEAPAHSGSVHLLSPSDPTSVVPSIVASHTREKASAEQARREVFSATAMLNKQNETEERARLERTVRGMTKGERIAEGRREAAARRATALTIDLGGPVTPPLGSKY